MANFFPDGMQLPAPSVDTQDFWDACKEHRLVIQRCTRCGTYRFTPVPVCYECQSFDWSWEESRGIGEVFTFTIVVHPIHPATRDVIPYNAAVIQLQDCGAVKLTTNLIEVKNEDIYVGMPVEVVWEDTTPEVTLYRFRPIRSS